MKIQCPNCKAGYKIDLSKIPAIPEGGITTTCPKCKGKIPIDLDAEPAKENAEKSQNQIIPCPECGHMNISTTTCVQCGKVFSKEELTSLGIAIGE